MKPYNDILKLELPELEFHASFYFYFFFKADRPIPIVAF